MKNTFFLSLTAFAQGPRKVDLQKGYNDIWLRELADFPVGVLSYRLSTSELSTSGKIIKH